uniref:RxLR effector candidate protein n=1 Tax=Hyaloperonospora arabidopsidis (strain Emoy2) TaxID=559515 RepID=M4B2M5_HYAAE
MVIGWVLCSLCLITMATLPLEKPYFPEASWRTLKPPEYTKEESSAINYHAPASGGIYVVLMMLATLGYVVADVAADGVVVEYAQREPISIRGRTQTAIYTVRTIFSIFGSLLVGFGLSSPPYGGDFAFGISFPMCSLVLAVCCVPVLPLTWYFVSEERVENSELCKYMSDLWVTMQSRAVYQVIAYNFFSGVLGGISYVASDPVTMYWARATSFNISVSQVIASGVTACTLTFMGRYGLGWDWRCVIIITTLSVVALDSLCTILTIWDVVRNQWFWLGLPIVETIPSSVNFIVSSFVVVELAEKGNEAAIYGLLTTVGNLSNPFSATLTKAIDEKFAVDNRDILNDSKATRRDVTIVVLIAYACKLLSLLFLGLLPRQKAQTQELKNNGQRSKLLAGMTIAYCTFALAWSLVINLLGIFDSTRCLKIVGGC